MFRVAVGFLIVTLAVPGFAQTLPPDEDVSPWEFWVRGNAMQYENFYQAAEGSPEEDETALGAEAGLSFGFTPALHVYGSASYLHFVDDAIEGSPGFRVGLRGGARPHAFDVYAEQLNNRPSFDLDEFQGADISRINGEYSYRFLEHWQVSVDGLLEEQEFDGTPERDNEFAQAGAALRWRGSRLFSPEIGFRTGEREVNDATQTYDQSEMYLQIRSQPTPKWYLSLRYRTRERDYANVVRTDDRDQISLGADYSMTDHLVLNLYGAKETVDSSIEGRDFDSGFWLAGFTWKF